MRSRQRSRLLYSAVRFRWRVAIHTLLLLDGNSLYLYSRGDVSDRTYLIDMVFPLRTSSCLRDAEVSHVKHPGRTDVSTASE